MSLLFEVSHRSASVSVLEQLSTDEADQARSSPRCCNRRWSPGNGAVHLQPHGRSARRRGRLPRQARLHRVGALEHCGIPDGRSDRSTPMCVTPRPPSSICSPSRRAGLPVVGEQVLGQVRRAYARRPGNHRRAHPARAGTFACQWASWSALGDQHHCGKRLRGFSGPRSVRSGCPA